MGTLNSTQINSGHLMRLALRHKIYQSVAHVTLATLAWLATCAHSGGMTEAEMVRQLSSRPAAASNDPNAAFANEALHTKSLARVRKPDTQGACLADRSASVNTKTLVVIALPPAEAPQVTLPLQFANASHELSTADMQQLITLARAMRSNELHDARFTVAGHTDASGDPLFNEKLSCARSLAVRTFLIEQGVAPICANLRILYY